MIVVGVDDSPGAKAALLFALDEARLRQATLRAVHAWQSVHVGSAGIGVSYPGSDTDLSELRTVAESALDAMLHEAVPTSGGEEIERRVVEGSPAAVLLAESHEAELLVVGSRGLGGFSGLLLGSVSQQCAHHAACPVVIVRAPAEASD
jgi:nucleotide-binding universal stress UspA family protein